MTSPVYLTIDDGPSPTTVERVDWLVARQIPAILFCIGAHIVRHPDAVDHAIRQGFWIGNHSYSHRRFSLLDSETWRKEVTATEELIEAAFRRVGRPRTPKVFRFPFGDKGGERRAAAQTLLRAVGYGQPAFRDVTYDAYLRRGYALDADCAWTIETYEYRILDVAANVAQLHVPHPRTGGCIDDPTSSDILLIHDHPTTASAFYTIISALLGQGVRFVAP